MRGGVTTRSVRGGPGVGGVATRVLCNETRGGVRVLVTCDTTIAAHGEPFVGVMARVTRGAMGGVDARVACGVICRVTRWGAGGVTARVGCGACGDGDTLRVAHCGDDDNTLCGSTP